MTERKTVILLFLAAVVTRVLLFVVFADELIVGSDQVEYIRLGQNFAAGNFHGVLDVYRPPFFPMLLGLASLLIQGLVLPAVMIAVLAGSIAVPLTYYFVKQSYGERDARLAGMFAVFYPHLLNSVFSIGSENVYLVLITLCLLTGWKALTSDSVLHYALAGGLVGLAYLTRPEAFAYTTFFIGAILVKIVWKKEQPVRRLLLFGGVFLISFLLFATPYLLYLKTETGNWTVSGKTTINTVLADHEAAALNEVGEAESRETAAVLVMNIVSNLVQVNTILPYLVPLGVGLFIALGLFGTIWGAERLKREAYLIGFVVLTVLGYTLAVVQTRYFYVLLPIAFGWAARGIYFFAEWFRSSARKLKLPAPVVAVADYTPALCLVVLFLYLAPLSFFMRSKADSWQERAYEEKAAGIWLKDHAPAMSKVFSPRKLPPFYSGTVQVSPRSTEIDVILNQIKTEGVEYVVISDRSVRRNSYLEGLENGLQSTPGFSRVYLNEDNPDFKISIYKSE